MSTPFLAAGAQQGAIVIRAQYMRGWVDTVFKSDFLGLTLDGVPIFPASQQVGGTQVNWVVRRGSNDSVETFTEGQAQPAVDAQDYALASVSFTYFRAMAQVSGHAVDALADGGVNGIDVLDAELGGAASDVSHLMNTTFLTGAAGIETAIDDTTSYAGIARGAASWWESTETDVSGALTVASMEDLLEAIQDNDKTGKVGLVVGPMNQVTNYSRLAGTSFDRWADASDAAASLISPKFAGRPFVGIPGMTDTTILFLDTRPGMFAVKSTRPMQVKAMAPAGDSDVYQISTNGAFICRNPIKHGKLTNVTA